MPTLQDDRPTTRSRRLWLPGLYPNPDTRSIQIGLIWTLLVHLLLLLLAPQVFRSEFSPGRFVRPGTNASTYDIELDPAMFAARAPKPPSRFVETNPDANNNIPDKTDNFGAQNQQAAQPVPDKESQLRMPKTEGRKDFANDSQIVTGELRKPEPTPPVPPQQQQSAVTRQSQTHPKLEVPLPGYVKSQGDNPDAFGTEVAKFPEPSTGADRRVEGDRNSRDAHGSGAEAAKTVRPQPQARPHLAQVRPGILEERPIGVSNAGHIAVDAHFRQFGDYLQELIDIVQIQWERIIDSSNVRPKTSHVTIVFRINSQGQIAEIVKVEGDADEYGTGAALSAIRGPAPYRPWTKEMVAVLGDDQTITFVFYYW